MTKKISNLAEVKRGMQYDREEIYAASDLFFEDEKYWCAVDMTNGRTRVFKDGWLILGAEKYGI